MWDERLSVTRLSVTEGEELALPLEGVAATLCTAGTVVVRDETKTFTLTGTQSVMYVGDSAQLSVAGQGELYIAAQR